MILSYKTYTMGSAGNSKQVPPEQLGIIPRVIRKIFSAINKSPKNTAFKLKVSFLELYNEDIRDMLSSAATEKTLLIREDNVSGVYVQNLVEEEVHSMEEMENVLIRGSLNRTTGSTMMNAVSSRSHAVFSITILKQEPDEASGSYKLVRARFDFVDLAGSERLSKTKAEGTRMKEGIHINGGLLALGNVISALGDPKKRARHVPYRDSKLTRILQDSLGGNSRTVMIACCSPNLSSLEETINTLKYADRARQIKNKPILNIDPMRLELIKLQKQVFLLQKELLRYKQEELSQKENVALNDVNQSLNASSFAVTTSSNDQRMILDSKAVVQLQRENEKLSYLLSRSERKTNLLINRFVQLEVERSSNGEKANEQTLRKRIDEELEVALASSEQKKGNTTVISDSLQKENSEDVTVPKSAFSNRRSSTPTPAPLSMPTAGAFRPISPSLTTSTPSSSGIAIATKMKEKISTSSMSPPSFSLSNSPSNAGTFGKTNNELPQAKNQVRSSPRESNVLPSTTNGTKEEEVNSVKMDRINASENNVNRKNDSVITEPPAAVAKSDD